MRNWNRDAVDAAITRNAFSSYLWGIETREQLYRELSHMFVFILPMRNWNCIIRVYSCICKRFRFHLTYEELKREKQYYLERPGKVFILPMRNWNKVLLKFLFSTLSVFILPMRNWNTNWAGNQTATLNIVFILPMRNWKGVAKLPIQWFRVFILPMRWSLIENKTEFAKLLSFSSYLWGIETSSTNPNENNCSKFSSPMRIETHILIHGKQFVNQVFILPMRWNRIV